MTYSLNIPLEMLRGLLTCAGWWLLFYRLHRPVSKLRRIALLVSIPACYLFWRLIPLDDIGNASLWAGMIILFALLCGDLQESLFTAVYYIGIEQCIDVIRSFIGFYTTGEGFRRYTPSYYLQFNLEYLVVLGWAFFYYWVMKNRPGKLPLRFWILAIIPPFGSTVLLTRFSEKAYMVLNLGIINIYLEGILIGLFLFALNLFTFYMYVRLLSYYESHLQTQVLQGQLDAYAHRAATIEAFQRQIGEMRHELKNLLFTLKIDMEQQNYEGVNNRVRNLLGDLKLAEPEHYTGNALIDAVISYKAAQIRELGAVFSVQADLPDIEAPGGGLAEAFNGALAYDIASIMGITLDNVMDAVVSMEASGLLHAADDTAAPPAVHCAIQKQKNLLLIKLTNPLPRPLRYKNGEIQSTKTESDHGLGLSALRRIVQKYSGDVTITDSGNVFCLSVMVFV
jgi:hypothetical protein